MNIPHKISDILPSTRQKLLKSVEICLSSDKNNFAQFFWDMVYIHTTVISVALLVACRTSNRKVASSIPANAVCFTVWQVTRDVNRTRFSRVPKKFPVPGKEISRSGEFLGNCKIHTKLACVTRNRRRQHWRTRLCPGQEGRRTHIMLTACEMTGE